MRAGDADRQAAVDRLTAHLTAGRLDLTEFDQRVAKAYAATYLDELPGLFQDLPEPDRSDAKWRKGFATSTPWVPPTGSMPGGSPTGGMSGPAGRYPPMPPRGYPGTAGWFAGRALRVLLAVVVALALLGVLFESRGFFIIPLIFIGMAIFRGGRRGRGWAGTGRPPWR
jgi:hypothetical protein